MRPRRAPAAAVLVGAAIALAAPQARAQSPEVAPAKQPIIDSHTRRTAFGGSIRIAGHLTNAGGGERVALQRRLPGESYEKLRTRVVSARGRVAFLLTDPKRTARYRLSYTDPAGGTEPSSSRAVVAAVAARVMLRLRPHETLAGKRVRIVGHLYPKEPGRRVAVARRRGGRWKVIRTPSVYGGDFSTSLVARRPGTTRIRAVFRGDATNSRARRIKRVTVFARAPATWYGPGFYGHRTACGRRLTRRTIGVAHRRLSCGTDVEILYRGRTIAVEVIDRGPYSGADWDLTRATARRLNFYGRNTIGVTH